MGRGNTDLQNQLSSLFVERRSEKRVLPCVSILWCRLAKLHSRCCNDLYLWIKNVKIREVVKAVGFQSRDLRWYSCVQSGFCGLHFMFTNKIKLQSLVFNNVIDARWALVLPVFWSFWPGILEIYFPPL